MEYFGLWKCRSLNEIISISVILCNHKLFNSSAYTFTFSRYICDVTRWKIYMLKRFNNKYFLYLFLLTICACKAFKFRNKKLLILFLFTFICLFNFLLILCLEAAWKKWRKCFIILGKNGVKKHIWYLCDFNWVISEF
jgi:hypothetical protein